MFTTYVWTRSGPRLAEYGGDRGTVLLDGYGLSPLEDWKIRAEWELPTHGHSLRGTSSPVAQFCTWG